MVAILAAGKGTRMKSALPKVLHLVCGVPMVDHVLDTADALGSDATYLIVGHGADEMRSHVGNRARFVVQEPQRGTGHAVQQILPYLDKFDGDVLILSADVPLVNQAVCRGLLQAHRAQKADFTLLTAHVPGSPTLGRIVKDANQHVVRIVEAREATTEELAISEVNAGTYCASAAFLREYLPQCGLPNAQNEIYLTDLVILGARDKRPVRAVCWPDPAVTLGVNTRVELANVSGIMRTRILERLMLDGVTVVDPASTWVEPNVQVGQDTILLPGTILEGCTVVGRACHIGPYTRITDSRIGDGCSIQNSVVKEAEMAEACTVGPFAYLRPQARLAKSVKVGDFVEIKNALIGEGSKVPHLAYVGDATLGRHVNIGAGTITCNYDGRRKHHTTIEDDVHIGANTNLVAPVRVGRGATTGAGAVVTKDVPEDSLAVGVPARVVKKVVS
ncbi:MAG: bifunctional UDP-N-acetylglucosamine diphosphorylase/glucosamine-1-phosphate N-acetyltransferase GlmU [Candidatus Xenobia bacterium]